MIAFFWDLWCIVSVVGIWPRFIEPRLLKTTRHTLSLPNFPHLTVCQLSDLHLCSHLPNSFLKKIVKRVNKLQPDLVLFTGDFINRGKLDEADRLLRFLSQLKGRHGQFACLGNHDYENYVSMVRPGEIEAEDPQSRPALVRAFRKLLGLTSGQRKKIDPADHAPHTGLVSLLEMAGFTLLENTSQTVKINGQDLNICGLGEHTVERTLPQEAFGNWKEGVDGLVLLHNPDGLPSLASYPGEVVFSGHTHGGQVNLPWFRDRLICLEHKEWLRGLHKVGNKFLYVNRGLGGEQRFRWCAKPDLLYLTVNDNV